MVMSWIDKHSVCHVYLNVNTRSTEVEENIPIELLFLFAHIDFHRKYQS
jgi:hypothetical protein